MKKEIVVFGSTEFSYMLAKYIEKFYHHRIIAFTVDEKYIKQPYLHEIPVLPFEHIQDFLSLENVEFIIGLGYKSMNSLRESVYHRLVGMNLKIGSFRHPNAVIEATEIGTGNIFLSGTYVGYGSKIGNGNIFWNNCNISHDASIGDFNYFAPSATFGGYVSVQNKCFFGLNCTVRNNIEIADSTLIGAGAYISKGTEPYGVYVPAKSVKLAYTSTEMNI